MFGFLNSSSLGSAAKVDDDTVYHPNTVLALVLAAKTLPKEVAPGFWCEEASWRYASNKCFYYKNIEMNHAFGPTKRPF